MSKEEVKIDASVIEKITEYVQTNYKSYKDKKLIIEEFDGCFTICKNPTASPLILSKKIIK
jgi:hypothetical protein